MTTQSERDIEVKLIDQLEQLEYTRVYINDEDELVANLKAQLERLNGIEPFSEKEFQQIDRKSVV